MIFFLKQKAEHELSYIETAKPKAGGRGRSSIYRDIDLGRLPPPLRLGGRVYWLEQDIDYLMQTIGKGVTEGYNP